MHRSFDRFEFCLEPTVSFFLTFFIPSLVTLFHSVTANASRKPRTANRYHIKRYPEFPSIANVFLPSDDFITFTAHDGRYPPPDENLLALHASVAAILHASGMSETIERIIQERDE